MFLKNGFNPIELLGVVQDPAKLPYYWSWCTFYACILVARPYIVINVHINLSSNSSHKSIFLDNLNEKVIILSFLAYIFIKRTFLQKKREGKKVKEPWLYSTYLEILKILACSGLLEPIQKLIIYYLVSNSVKSRTFITDNNTQTPWKRRISVTWMYVTRG